jgi:hypothetical protein
LCGSISNRESSSSLYTIHMRNTVPYGQYCGRRVVYDGSLSPVISTGNWCRPWRLVQRMWNWLMYSHSWIDLWMSVPFAAAGSKVMINRPE